MKIPEEKNSRSTRCMTPKRIREPVDMGELAAKYFGSENGVELELPKREIHEPVSFN